MKNIGHNREISSGGDYLDDEDSEIYDNPEIFATQSRIGERVANVVGDVIYADRKGFKKYRIIKAGREKITEWKKGIDELITVIKEKNVPLLLKLMTKDGHQKSDHRTLEKLLAEEEMDEKDIVLLAIGLFAIREKSSWNPIKTRIKMLTGGNVKMESIFEKGGMANCYDINVFVKEMAALYGIKGKVEGRGIRHSKFVTDEEKICDPMFGWRRGGLFQSRGRYEEFMEEKAKTEGLREKLRSKFHKWE